jgi:hypothetical protein
MRSKSGWIKHPLFFYKFRVRYNLGGKSTTDESDERRWEDEIMGINEITER